MLKGILAALTANILFGLGYYFAILLQPLSDQQMLGFRIIILMPIILFAIFAFRQQYAFRELWQKICQKPALVIVMVLLTLNTGVQLWLFLWAPNNGQALQVSIGYLLLPIVAVLFGKILFKEHFSSLKWWAVGFAILGVGSNILMSSAISWATFVAGFGYPIYIALRRYFQINHLATFWLELALLLPFALYFISTTELEIVLRQNAYFYLYLALLGIVNGAAFILYISASNWLPINVLGLIGYAEPLVMLLISFAIGEVLEAKSYLLMFCLLCAIALLSVDSFKENRD
ncbi:EamA family transporter RarD [Bibersteinia trehalosi]|uniref:EamA family transporter RarD n=1 Tax=Bibersteinia trehalosi TaxID=47735 RepID=UPI002D7A3F5F|nr:EamA family transporter RarD [Bibersteinia trehalosi]